MSGLLRNIVSKSASLAGGYGLRMIKAENAKNSLEDVQDELKKQDQESADKIVSKVTSALKKYEDQDPDLKSYAVRGTQFHKSSLDPSDPEHVLSVQLFSDEKGTKRVRTVHIHKDGSSTAKPPLSTTSS
ncbi:hypothetical protein FB446DRAFT_799997 [Lentinula raphanica]|nr:hypothetical protein FB446DRAFT_799997 [Lentinula raphanica]